MRLREKDLSWNRIRAVLTADKKKAAIVLLCLAAILLLLLSECVGGAEKTPEPQQPQDTGQYGEALEEELSSIISCIEGAGKTQVMITLRSSAETVYARNGKVQKQEESDRTQSDEEQSYVLLRSGSEEKGLELRTNTPQIQGVAVVCEGAENPQVRQNITDTVTATLGVGASHVSVVKMQSERN